MNLFDNYFLSRIELREEKSHHRPFILKIYIFSIIEEKRKQEKKKKKTSYHILLEKLFKSSHLSMYKHPTEKSNKEPLFA